MSPEIKKRIKSAGISLGSLLIAAAIVTVATPEFAGAFSDLAAYLRSVGVPASVVALGAVFVSELWRAWLNGRKLDRASEMGGSGHKLRAVRDFELY